MCFRFLFAVFTLSCLAFTRPAASAADIATARTYYEKAVNSKPYAEQLNSFTAAKKGDAIMRAYYGVSQALLAKHHWNPWSKYSLVQAGLAELNKAAVSDKQDLEIRFLRFSVEENLPAIVSFTSHISEDKLFILSNLRSSHSYYNTIRAYMLKSSNVTDLEKKKL